LYIVYIKLSSYFFLNGEIEGVAETQEAKEYAGKGWAAGSSVSEDLDRRAGPIRAVAVDRHNP
jgi:hypothetical protein